MATLTLSPFGLSWSRNLLGAAPTVQLNVYKVKKGYTANIGFGDLVETRTGSTVYGYVGIYTAGDSHSLGVFYGCLPYFDTVLNQVVNAQMYNSSANPSGDVDVLICDDPFAVFVAQLGGTNASNPGTVLDRGGNIDLAQNGSPNTSTGISTGYLDATTYNNTTATLPLRIVGQSTRFFLGYNPSNATAISSPPTNNYLEVRLNTSENLTATGI